MPTLPLYDAAAPPQAYHHVIAPGGYEFWAFRVMPRGPAAPRHIALTFYDGRPHDPDYRRRYRNYRRRPTRHSPPVPADYRGTELTVGISGARQSITFVPCAVDGFFVADDGTELRCGDAGGFGVAPDGSIRASHRNDGTLLELLLRPRDGSRVEPVAVPLTGGGVVGRHWRVVAPTIYEVMGQFDATRFDGTGSVEHCWGTALLSATSGQ